MPREIPVVEESYDVVVIGGGLAGICAAVAAARQGRETVLVQNRPVLGGNSSAEIGVPPHGADQAGSYRHVRETGIIDEIATINASFPNYLDSPSIWSLALWSFCQKEENLTVYLNTHAGDVETDGARIVSVMADQLTTEKRFRFSGKIFIDCSGDGVLGYRAGADFMTGRESRDVYGEPMGHETSDQYGMGNSVYMRARDVGQPVPFKTPDWVHVIPDDKALPDEGKTCPHPIEHLTKPRGGWWWMETGGRRDTIAEAEEIRDELYRHAIGVWDHLKNRGEHGAENYVLESIVTTPGTRDSRRFFGDYVMVQQDVEEGRLFDDAVAYGGWHIDVHHPDGIKAKSYWRGRLLKGIYTIPYRSLYSRNIENLLFAGRNISASHIAFASSRVMLTCALVGQAAGNAAALCLKHGCTPREVSQKHIHELQQNLRDQDCYIPGLKDQSGENLAPLAKVEASSERTLSAPEPELYRPLDVDRAQMFVVSSRDFEGVSLFLENSTSGNIKIGAELRAARRLDDFRSESSLATATAEVPPGRHLVRFQFDYRLPKENAPYWILLRKTDGISWGYSKQEEPGTQSSSQKNQYFTEPGAETFLHRERGTNAFILHPESRCFGPDQVISGITRPEEATNEWISGDGLPQWIGLSWEKAVSLREVQLTFDNHLDRTLAQWSKAGHAPTLAKSYTVTCLNGDTVVDRVEVDNNEKRKAHHCLNGRPITSLRIDILQTWGGSDARLFEVRALTAR